MRLIRCFSFGKVSNSRAQLTRNLLTKSGTERFRENILPFTGKCVIVPSLTVKFIKTPLKALFYLGFSAVPFRFTI